MNKSELLSEKLQAVYNRLQDEESKAIFMSRLCHFYTGEISYLHDMVESAILFTSKRKRKYERSRSFVMFDEFINIPNYCEKEIVIYGAGFSLWFIYPVFERFGLKIRAICDSNPEKISSEQYGFKIISPEELIKDYSDANIIVTAFFKAGEIINFLLDNGYLSENIVLMADSEEVYFGPDFIQPVANECYLDVGLCNIKTIKNFIRFCGDNYKKIIAFEPDKDNFVDCVNQVNQRGYKNVEIINKGAYSSRKTICFEAAGSGISKISETGNTIIEAITIDEIVGDDKVTFIKMDIEGAELEALRGSRETIRKHIPRLAISIYHKPEDIIDILSFIHELIPEYRFWIRQYSYFSGETVLYCVI